MRKAALYSLTTLIGLFSFQQSPSADLTGEYVVALWDSMPSVVVNIQGTKVNISSETLKEDIAQLGIKSDEAENLYRFLYIVNKNINQYEHKSNYIITINIVDSIEDYTIKNSEQRMPYVQDYVTSYKNICQTIFSVAEMSIRRNGDEIIRGRNSVILNSISNMDIHAFSKDSVGYQFWCVLGQLGVYPLVGLTEGEKEDPETGFTWPASIGETSFESLIERYYGG